MRGCSGRCSGLNTSKTKYNGMDDGMASKGGCRAYPEGYLDAHGQCDSRNAFLESCMRELAK